MTMIKEDLSRASLDGEGVPTTEVDHLKAIPLALQPVVTPDSLV